MTIPHVVLVTAHLLCAVVFGGAVAFEVVILSGLQQHFSPRTIAAIERAIEARAVPVLPFVIIVLYGTGALMFRRYFPDVADVFSTSMGRWLLVKIVLAVAVMLAVATALVLLRRNRLTLRRTKALHRFVLACIVLIVVIAKAMFYV